MQRTKIGAPRRRLVTALGLALILPGFAAPGAIAQKDYATGVTDTEIKLGQTMPYSGPASPYSAVGKAESAYFKMINEQGGVNGRKINLISLDDAYSPPKTVEQTRRLVEEDHVAFIWQALGTPTNTAIQRYLNDRKIPQLFISTFASKFNDPQHFPWTMGGLSSYRAEGQIYGQYILQHHPNGRIAVLYQNDDYGKDYEQGLREGLGDKAATMIVAEATYEVSDPTVNSQIVTLQASGADVFYDVSGAKFAAQAIRKVYDIGWKPVHFLNSVSSSVAAVLKPAGLDKSTGIISVVALKDPNDPRWHDDPGTGLAGMDEEILSRWGYRRFEHRIRLHPGANARGSVEAVWRQSQSPKHYGTSRATSRACPPDAAAGNNTEHNPHRLSAAQAIAHGEIQRPDLGNIWRSDADQFV